MYFEQPFLNSSKEYYSSCLKNDITVVEYLKYIEELFVLEQERFTDIIAITMSKVKYNSKGVWLCSSWKMCLLRIL